MRFNFLIVFLCLFIQGAISQQWAGPDKNMCEYGSPVQIGSNDPCEDCCYVWSHPELLSCSDCKNPNVIQLPDNTTFTVEVRNKNLKLLGKDEVEVKQAFGDIHFTPKFLIQGSDDTVVAEVLVIAGNLDPDEIYWDFEGNDLGCEMDVLPQGNKAWILPGINYGKVTVRADYNGPNVTGECYTKAEIEINNGVKDVIAVDLEHDDRTAGTGDTLYVVGHGDVQIKAIPNEGGFHNGNPDWKPDAFGSATPPDMVAINMMSESPTLLGRESDYQAGEAPDYMPKVKVIRKAPVVTESEVGTGFQNFVDKIQEHLKFMDSEFEEPECGSFTPLTVSLTAPTFRLKSSLVEKFKDPDLGIKEEITLDAGIAISGKIYHPVFTKHAYVPVIDIYVCSQLYGEATASLTVSATASKDPSQMNSGLKLDNLQAELGFALSGNLVFNVESDDYAAVASAVFTTAIKPKVYFDVATNALQSKVEYAPATVKVTAKVKNISNPAEVKEVFKLPSVEVQLLPAFESPPYLIYQF